MCIIGYFWIGVVVKVLSVPQPIVITLVAMFCVIGGYTERNDITDVWMIFIFGVVGYLCEKFEFPVAPIVLGTILGPVAESAFVRTMIRYENDWTVFFTRPISGVILTLALLALVLPVLRHLRGLRDQRRRDTLAGTGEPSRQMSGENRP
jgi:putative tricarboxylic transport membrane protein